jgi:hypothetical protein
MKISASQTRKKTVIVALQITIHHPEREGERGISPGGDWPQFTVTSASLAVLGVWHHVAYTYDQSEMKLY